jgi:hypothetical protein
LFHGPLLILTDTMSSQDFLDYGWRIPYSEFVIGSSRFLYPIKITETSLSKIKKEQEEVKIPTLLKFYKNQLILAHLQPLPLLVFYLMTVFTLMGYIRFRLFQRDFY